MYTIYRHITLDTNKTFYIGIGNKERPYNKWRRNKFWKSIVKKHGLEIQVLKSDLTWEDACELEINLISFYGRRDLGKGYLTNLTDGGDGTSNKAHSEETRRKMSESGKKKIFTENHRKNLSIANSGVNHVNFGKHLNESTRKKLSILNSKGNHNMAKKVINTSTKEIFDCVNDAADSLKMKATTLRAMLRGQNKNKTHMIYV